MTRKSYKSLYLHQLQAAGEERGRAECAERELAKLRAVLASAGERVLRGSEVLGIPGSIEAPGGVTTEGIFLPPVAFECAKAYIASHDRFVAESQDYGMYFDYVWRGKRLIALP